MNFHFSDKIASLKPSAIREIFKYAADPSVISLSAGNPAPEAFPVEAVREISQKLLAEQPIDALQYSVTEGYPALRQPLTAYMNEHHNLGRDFDDILITSPEQMERLSNHFTIAGGGGTDFRPAFRYLEQLRQEGAFSHLRGMLYFTDGKGIYPTKRPPWDTAFVFVGDRTQQENESSLPGWAMRLTLDPEELERGVTSRF